MNIWIAVVLSVVIGFGVAFGLGFAVIPWLHKLKFGQTILDIGPSWHKKKQGTPTMGGILFIAGFAVSLTVVLVTDKLLGGDLLTLNSEFPENRIYVKVFAGIGMALSLGFIGFIDDYIKVVKKRNLGLTELQKTALELMVAVVFLFTLQRYAGGYTFIPYVGVVESAALFWIVGIPAIYCTVNAANFLDGVDGLCASVTSVVCVGFSVCAVLRGVGGLSVVFSALFGALSGYLIWNWNPSKVMMGDLGSLFLGGMVVTGAYAIDAPWAILLIGIIYVAEFGSDVLQIAFIKLFHKKLLRMAPIHHHYELGGWSEKRLCVVFSLITALGSAAAIALTWFGSPK